MGFLDDILGAERIAPRTVDPSVCGCCAGGTSGIGYICIGCRTAMENRDRLGHPHPLSDGQRALVEQNAAGGAVEDVTAHGFRNADGTITVVGVGPLIVDQAGSSAREIEAAAPDR